MKTIVEMLEAKGFTCTEMPELGGSKVLFLEKTYEKDVEVCWYGSYHSTLKIVVLVNVTSGICRLECFNGSAKPYKSRWYDTIGKRTYNAISDTIKNAGYEI
jgi:hypothetical protein